LAKNGGSCRCGVSLAPAERTEACHANGDGSDGVRRLIGRLCDVKPEIWASFGGDGKEIMDLLVAAALEVERQAASAAAAPATEASLRAASRKAHTDRNALLALKAAKADKITRAEAALDALYEDVESLESQTDAQNRVLDLAEDELRRAHPTRGEGTFPQARGR
jgi:hypothetical protein